MTWLYNISPPTKRALLFAWLAGLMAMAWLMPAAWAATGSVGGTNALAQFGAHRESVEDMRVKVLGGHIRVVRNWDKDAWYINRRWAPIKEIFDAASGSPSTSGNSPPGAPTLERGGNYYLWKSGNTYVDEDDVRKTLTKTETGWRWADRKGNWIAYDATRKPVGYGDRNDVTVHLKYDAEGRLTGVFDHFNKQILWYEYNPANQISAIRDYTNRKVQYLYTSGNLSDVIDVRGNTWKYGYTDKMLTTKIDPENRVTTLTYNGTIVASVKDASGVGSTTKYEYNKTRKEFYKQEKASSGKITETWYDIEGDTIRQDINGTTVYTMQKDGRRRIETDSVGNVTTKEYDEWDNLTKITYADGSSVSYQIDPVYSNVLQKTDERGIITKYSYDAKGKLKLKTEAFGRPEERQREYIYDVNGYGLVETYIQRGTTFNKQGVRIAQEIQHQYTYDNFGNLDSYTDPETNVIDYLDYDAAGNLKQWKDGRGKTWQKDYDAAGNLISQTNPLLHKVSYQYDKSGLRTHTFDPDNRVMETRYDNGYRKIAEIGIDGSVQQWHHNPKGQLSAFEDAEAKFTHFEYDVADRLYKIIDGNNNVIEYRYGEANTGARFQDISSIVYPTYMESFHYDKRNRRTTTIRKTNEYGDLVEHQEFDAAGNPHVVTDAENKTTVHDYDGLNRLITTTNALQHTVKNEYDDRDNIIRVINEKNIPIRYYVYDSNDRQREEHWPLGEIIKTEYDANGNLNKKTDAKGQIARFIYNDANRLNIVEYFSSVTSTTPDKTVHFDYDKQRRLTGYQDGTTSATYVYDDIQRTRTEIVNYGSFSKSFTDTYYRNGFKKAFTVPDSTVYGYSYDSANRLSAITIPGEGAITYTDYQWHQPKKVALPGGANKLYQYDSLQRILRITGNDPANKVLLDYNYAYDAVGHIKTNTTEHGVYTYGYDDIYRLTSAANPTLLNETYTYDPAGNRKTDSALLGEWLYNDNNQLTDYGTNGMQYDANGSPTQRTVNGQTLIYVHDIENRLQQIKDASQTVIASYYYDPFGRRLWKDVGGSKTYFLYAREGLIAEFDASGQQQQSYGYYPGSQFGTAPLYTRTQTGYAYYHTDHLGTSKVLTRGNGEVVWAASSTAFGQTTVTTNIISNPLRFPGQYYDQESGLHYNWYRYYDTELGRYLTTDPIGLGDGLNTYSYVTNNPLRWVDPLGLFQVPSSPEARLALGLSRAGAITQADGPAPFLADAAGVGFALGTIIGYGLDKGLSLSVSDDSDTTVIPFPGISNLTGDDGEQCLLDPDDPDQCELERNFLILEEIKIKEDARGAPKGANQIEYARRIRDRKKAWNKAVDNYNTRCPRKIGRRFTDV